MSRTVRNVCRIDEGGFSFGKAAEPFKVANRAIIVQGLDKITIKFDNRGPATVRKKGSGGGFMVGGRIDAQTTGKIGRRYYFEVKNGCICIDLEKEFL